MQITLKNIGTIEQASFDLDKDLIVFVGPNNTGKTYAAYCLYGLGRFDKFLHNQQFENLFPDMSALFSEGKFEIDLLKIFTRENLEKILEQCSVHYKTFLPRIFALSEDKFEQSNIQLRLKQGFCIESFIADLKFSTISAQLNEAKYSFSKEKNSHVIEIAFESRNLNGHHIQIDKIRSVQFIKEVIWNNILSGIISINEPIFLTAERIGISLFWKDIYGNRFVKANDFAQIFSDNIDKAKEYIDRNLSSYSQVLLDSFRNYDRSIRYAGDFVDNPTFNKLVEEIETRILKGAIHADENSEVYFTPSSSKPIKIQHSGSNIKSLASLIFYLKSDARVGQTLFIDEPEINLHPDNQRLVARILAKLSKLGVKVIISTHSDYIIREINNLIMLYKEHPETKDLREKFGYDESEI